MTPTMRCCWPAGGVAAALGGGILKAVPPSAATLVERCRQQNAIRYAEGAVWIVPN